MGPDGTMKTEVGHNKGSRTQLVMLGGLSVVALAVGIRMVSSGPQSAPAASVTASPGAPVVPGTPSASSKSGVTPITVTWPTDLARDPFHSELVFPPAAPPPEPVKVDPAPVKPVAPPVDVAALAREKIHLKGTILGERPIAMANGRVYRVGEVVEGFKIVEIVTNQITVERDGSRVAIDAN